MENIENILLQLTEIDSPSGYEKNISDYLVHYLSEIGIQVEQDDSLNVFAQTKGRGKPLFIAAHMDTVEPGRGIRANITDDMITSNGETILGADNKATIAVVLKMLLLIKDMGNSPQHRPLDILFTTHEETTNLGAKKFNFANLRATEGIAADYSAPIGTIVLRSPAYLRFTITLTGTASHASSPGEAKSVLPVLRELLTPEFIGILDKDTILNIGQIQVGSARNTIPGQAVLEGEIRSFEDKKVVQYVSLLQERCTTLASKTGIAMHVASVVDNPSYVYSRKLPLVSQIAQSYQSLGITPQYTSGWSCSDCNIFQKRGIQVVNLGDGTEKTHTVDETVSVSALQKLLEFFMRFSMEKGTVR